VRRSRRWARANALTDSLAAFIQVWDNPDLRRVQLGFAGSVLGQWGYVVALAVYAHQQGAWRWWDWPPSSGCCLLRCSRP
jgi:hypothetical protein